MLVVGLVEEDVLAVALVLRPVLEHACGRDTMLGTELLPELMSAGARGAEVEVAEGRVSENDSLRIETTHRSE